MERNADGEAKTDTLVKLETLKRDLVNFLMSSQEGVTPEFLYESLEGLIGEREFYKSAGYPSFRSFLHFACYDVIEVRSLRHHLAPYIFAREETLSEESRHIRRMVLEQKPNLKAGPIIPTYENTIAIGTDILMLNECPKNPSVMRIPPLFARPPAPPSPRYPYMGYGTGSPYPPPLLPTPPGYGPQVNPYYQYQQVGYGPAYAYGVPFQPQHQYQNQSPRSFPRPRTQEFTGKRLQMSDNQGYSTAYPSVFTQEVTKRLGFDGSNQGQAQVPIPSAYTILGTKSEPSAGPENVDKSESEVLASPQGPKELQVEAEAPIVDSEEKQEFAEVEIPSPKEEPLVLDPKPAVAPSWPNARIELEFDVDHNDTLASDMSDPDMDISDTDVDVDITDEETKDPDTTADPLVEVPLMKWNKEMELILTEYVSWNKFMLSSTDQDSIKKLEKQMTEFYASRGVKVPEEKLQAGGIYAVEFSGCWKRAQLKEVKTELHKIRVLLIDHGRTTLFRFKSNVFELTTAFRLQPKGSIDCCLPIFKFVHKRPALELDAMMKAQLDQLFFVEAEGFTNGILQVSFIQNMKYR